jgi:hypothetical protein
MDQFVFGGVGIAQLRDQKSVLQMRADADHDFFLAEGFENVIHSAGAEAFDNVLGFLFCGDEHHGGGIHAMTPAQLATGLKSVHPRQHHVEQHQIGLKGRVSFQGRLAAVRFLENISFVEKDAAQNAQVDAVVVHQQNFASAHGNKCGWFGKRGHVVNHRIGPFRLGKPPCKN